MDKNTIYEINLILDNIFLFFTAKSAYFSIKNNYFNIDYNKRKSIIKIYKLL